jgi:hypothetical protein
MTARTVRRIVCDAFLRSARLALDHGAKPDDVACAALAFAVNVSLDTVSPGQVAIELHRIADEIEELPPERPVSDA